MRTYTILVLTAILGLCSQIHAQSQEQNQVSPDGLFDIIFDHYGNQYNLEDLRIERPKTKPQKGDALAGNVIPPSTLLCNAGYFDIYFEEGSGCDLNSVQHIDRRNVICQVFTDMSNFIVPADPNVKVNIWVRNIGNVINYPLAMPVLGLASSFYTVPTLSSPVRGIIDGELWKTINTGVDGFTNVAAPLNSTGSSPGSGAFYHGMLAINFSAISLNWHTDLTTATAAGTFDLYSVVLHELTHALGFASLINSAGQPLFGNAYPFYSRYDLFLENGSGQKLITNNSQPCNMYDYYWNTSVNPGNTLSPDLSNCVPDRTFSCNNAIKFNGSVFQAVYTPNCFEHGSSLSHFEDECHSSGSNNLYFCMANAGGSGSQYMIRYLKPEERSVLCDLGYKVNTLYGNGLYAANDYNYGGSQHPGLEVAGVNDGMNNSGAYSWTVTTSGNVNFNGSDILGNDYGADEFECLEVINGMGTVNIPAGNASSVVTFTSGSSTGVALLRYIPVNTQNGARGNITYIHVYIHDGNCIPDACNMIMNNGFETGASCGTIFPPDLAQISCWDRLIGTPDYYVRTCVPFDVDKTIPTGPNMTNNPGDSWSGSGNEAFLGLGFYNGWMEEAEQSILSTPLNPGVSYVLSFWAKSANSTSGGFAGENRLMFRGASGILAAQPAGTFTSVGDYLTEITVPDDDEWHFYSVEFTAPGSGALDNFLVGNLGNNSGSQSYVFIDDLTLSPTNISTRFDLQESLCEGELILDDLTRFVFPPTTNGIFSGPGVSYNGGIPSFTAPGNGWFTLLYTYTNAIGCTVTLPARIFVTPRIRPVVTLTSNPPTPPGVMCGTPVTITAGGAKDYEWYSPFSVGATIPCIGPCTSITVTPPCPGYLYVVIGTDTVGCKDTTEIWVGVECPKGAAYRMPEDVKHYTTKMIPPDYPNGIINHSILAGTIFTQPNGPNKVHFMRTDNGFLLNSIQYPSTYPDERAVDLQSVTIDDVTYWYIICLARNGAKTLVKVLHVDDWGNLIDQREYDYPGGDLYAMNATVWTSGTNEYRLYICGYQTPSLGIAMPDYNTPKKAFVMAVDIDPTSPSFLQSIMLQTYNWQWAGTQDFDIATRMHALKDGSNNLWVTGSTNGAVPLLWPGVPQGDDRSATMNMVIDPAGNVVHERNFFEDPSGTDDLNGPSDYGIDLIQTDLGNFILGNKAINQGHAAWHPNNPVLMYPRANKSWWIQAVDDNFNPTGTRWENWSFWGHWASHALNVDGSNVTIATLLEYPMSNCIPTPFSPNYDNIQVNMVNVDLTNFFSPLGPSVTASKIYMTSSGTGDPTVPVPANSYYLLGDALSLVDYPPTFAASGIGKYFINAPKYDQLNQTLNLKVAVADPLSLGIECGGFDCQGQLVEGVFSLPPTSVQASLQVVMDFPSNNSQSPFQINGAPYRCTDFSGNPTYRFISPYQEDTKTLDSMKETSRVYPNPADEAITLRLGKEIPTSSRIIVKIQNTLSQDVKTLYEGTHKKQIELNIASLTPGVYILQVYADSKTILTEKLVVH